MSASPPAPAANNDEEQQKKALEQITFRFCQECSNMLYPKEDKLNSTLQFVCRHCFWSEPASSACIFRNNLNNSVGETAGVTQDVGSDPTVGCEYYFCALCGEEVGCSICGEGISGGNGDGGGGVDDAQDQYQEEYSKFATAMDGTSTVEEMAVGTAA